MTSIARNPSRQDIHRRAATPAGNFIAAEWTPSTGDTDLEVLDPSSAEHVCTVRAASRADVDAAVTAAACALPSWSARPAAERAEILTAMAQRCAEHAEELAELEVVDCGKPITAARAELAGTIDTMRLYAQGARLLSAPAAGDYVPGSTSLMRYEPRGVVAAITPWNYPLLEAAGKAFAAMATGNTVVLKPAETTPTSTARLAELSADLLPAGVFNVVFGDGPVAGDALVRHERIAMVSFTGSVATGRRIAATAGEHLTKVVLELGGNAPVLVFEDADVEAALDAIALGGLYNAGQDCMAASRLLVHESVHDQFVMGLITRCANTILGDPLDPATEMGPVISRAHRDGVLAKLAQRSASSEIVCGGHAVEGPGYYLSPTVVVGVDQNDPLTRQEIFGPVFTVQRFAEEAEALRMANDSDFGLSASVFSRDAQRGLRLANALHAGTVWVNDHLLYGPDLPMSGFRTSGVGTESSTVGLAEYCRLKHIALRHG